LESTSGSHSSSIQSLFDANYAPKSWVEDKNYATETYVIGAVLTTGAVNTLISTAITGYASPSQLASATDSINNLDESKVSKPFDWISYPPLNSEGNPTTRGRGIFMRTFIFKRTATPPRAPG